MRLISCYIENFGGINQKEFEFKPDINVFEWDNGTGKSTLAAFIKAMFYGPLTVKLNTKGFEDRRHFSPFNDGKFGGSLVFEHKGSEFRIERFFDKKSAVKDRVTVYKNGGIIQVNEDDIGKYFFGLDREAFEQTVFFSAEDGDIYTPQSIEAKINRAEECERAESILEEERKKLQSTRGKKGLLYSQQELVRELREEINLLQNNRGHMEELCARRDKVKKEIADNEPLIKRGIALEKKLALYGLIGEPENSELLNEADFDRVEGYFKELEELENKDKQLNNDSETAVKKTKRKKLLLAVDAFIIITASVLLLVGQIIPAVICVLAGGFLTLYLYVYTKKLMTVEKINVERRRIGLRYEFCKQEIGEFAVGYRAFCDYFDLKRDTLLMLEKQIYKAENETAGLEEKIEEIEKAEQKLEMYKEKLFVIEAAEAILNQAVENMRNKYAGPIKANFAKYNNFIKDIIKGQIIIDDESNIYFDYEGEQRHYKHLSQGQKMILAFCFRMALVDSLYDGEKPFVLMDDPFMSLDEENMEIIVKIVKAVSSDRQIIYFCCHSSRNISKVNNISKKY